MAMVLPGIVEAWNHWTDFSDPQNFMDQSRAHGYETIGAAVDAYVVEMTGMHREWAGLNAEELEEIRDVLMSYLFLTRGVAWS
jgi:hypothetical protein